MGARMRKRLERVGNDIASLPIRPELVQHALQFFRETGLLPEQQDLADAVCRRVLGGEAAEPATDDLAACIMRSLRIKVVSPEPEQPAAPSVRECLFDEAVYGPGIVRRAARGVLRLEVDFGADVTDPNFLADRTLPEYGTVGLHLLGFPQCLVRPPYEDQAQRLFTRYEDLRNRINRYGDDPWFDVLMDSVLRFQDTGTCRRTSFCGTRFWPMPSSKRSGGTGAVTTSPS